MILDEMDVSAVSQASETWVRSAIATAFWAWYDANPDRPLLTVRKWFFNHTFTVRELHGVFVLLFGAHP